jgi:hypothetical protein
MRFPQLSLYALVTIAAIAGTQSIALSQPSFKNPTHPTLSDLSSPSTAATPTIEAVQPQANSGTGQMFFSHAPTLVRVNALQKAAYTPSTYEFTISVPSDAGTPLQAVRIVQEENISTAKFNIGKSKAFGGERYAAGPELRLASVGGAQPPAGEATIVFDQPVQPGTTVTIALDVRANPTFGGVYEFGVTAFPAGPAGEGLFLGYGRINVYSGGN